jgi:hypothetical protein
MQKERTPQGLVDGGHVYLSCRTCNAILVDLHITRPSEPEVWKVKATCPFCGDCSYEREVQGGFHSGGYGKPKEDNPDDDIPSTVIDDFQEDGETVVFIVKKANEDAKPVKFGTNRV